VSSRLFLFVPPQITTKGDEVHHGDDDGHPQRDEHDGAHRLLPLLPWRRVTSGLPSLLPWFIGE
jgi:hypothetical protein